MKRLFLVCIAVVASPIVYCMQLHEEIILRDMDALLQETPRRYNAIADLLWEATETPAQLPLLFDKINAQVSKEECSHIVRFILSHGTDLHEFLFAQLFTRGTIQFQDGKQSNIEWYDVSPQGHFLIGQIPGQIFYGDLRIRPLKVNAQKILANPTDDFQYAFSENEDWLVYAHYPYIYRRNLKTSETERISYPYTKLTSDATSHIKIELLTDCFAIVSKSRKLAVSDQEQEILKIYARKGQSGDRRFVDELKIVCFDNPACTIDFNDTNKRYAVLGMCPQKRFIIIQDGYATKILFDLRTKKSFPLISNVKAEFSSNGNYLIQGISTQTLSCVDLRGDTLRNIPLCSAAPGKVFEDVTVLAERYIVAYEVFPGVSHTLTYNPSQGWRCKVGDKSGRLYIMDMAEHTLKYRDLSGNYVVSPAGTHIAWILNHELHMYDINQHIEKKLLLDRHYSLQALSPKGLYVIISSDDAYESMVLQIDSPKYLMRIPKMSYYMFYKNDDRYVIGMKQTSDCCSQTLYHPCKKIVGSAFYMWNLMSRTCVAKWEDSMSSHDKSLFNVYEYQSFPVLALCYSEQQQAFSLLAINDVIAHDTQLESLAEIEQAMYLALLSNKVSMVQHIESLSEMASKEFLLTPYVTSASFSYSFITSANRMQEYDVCLMHITQYVQAHSAPACGDMSTKRQKTIDDSKVRSMITGTCAQFFQPLDQECMDTLHSKAEQVSVHLAEMDSLIKEYYSLPVPVQELVSTMNCQSALLPNYFKLCSVMHGLASEHGVSLVPSKSWLHRVLDVYLTWTPKIQDLLKQQIKLAKIVFYFNEGVEESGGDDVKEVAVLLRSYLASLNTDDIKEIGQYRSTLYAQLHALFGSSFTLVQMLPLCRLTPIYLETLVFGEQLFSAFSKISESQEQKVSAIRAIEANRQNYISFIDSVQDYGGGIVGAFSRKLKEIPVNRELSELDALQLACLFVLPHYKLFYEKIPRLRLSASMIHAAAIFCQCYPDMVDGRSFKSSLEILNMFGSTKARSIKTFVEQLRGPQSCLSKERFLELLKEVKIPLCNKDVTNLYCSHLLCTYIVRGNRQEFSSILQALWKQSGCIDIFSGDTMLHMVTRYCAKKPESYHMVESMLMMCNSADMVVANRSHKTPADLARELGDEELAARIKAVHTK